MPPSGLKCAPWFLFVVVQGMLAAVRSLLRRSAKQPGVEEGIRGELRELAEAIEAYADDFFGCASPFMAAVAELALLIVGTWLGPVFDVDKTEKGAELEVLGVMASVLKRAIWLPARKARAYREEVLAWQRGELAASRLRNIVGRLAHAAQHSRWGWAWMEPLYHAQEAGELQPGPSTAAALAWWAGALEKPELSSRITHFEYCVSFEGWTAAEQAG